MASWVCGELGVASWSVASWTVARCTGPVLRFPHETLIGPLSCLEYDELRRTSDGNSPFAVTCRAKMRIKENLGADLHSYL